MALNLAFVGALSVAIFGEDSYVNDGSSSWSHRDAGAHGLYLAVVVVAVVSAAVLGLLAARAPESRTTRAAFRVGGIADLVLGYAVLFAFDNN